MECNRLRQIWQDGRAANNLWINLPNPTAAEFLGNQGWDSITIDQQHGLIDYCDVLSILQTLRSSPSVPIVRVASHDAALIGKCLDAGAAGIICPLVNTADECAAFVKACRYPPAGVRSFGPVRSSMMTGRNTVDADSYVITLAMIETKDGFENLEAICGTSGLDGVFIGPSDLSLALGFAPSATPKEPEVKKAIDRIFSVAKENAKTVGIYTSDSNFAEQMIRKGFDFVTVTSDLALLMSGVALRKRFRN